MLIDEVKRIDVAEHRTEQWNLLRQVDCLTEEEAMDKIAVHHIVHRALESAGAIDHQRKLRCADGEVVGKMNFPRPQLDGTLEGPEDKRTSEQALDHLQRV